MAFFSDFLMGVRAECVFPSDGRVRDPLEVLPLLAQPEPASSTSGRSRSRAARERAVRARANAALRSLAALTAGRRGQLRDTAWGSATEWTRSHELPRVISERVLECHRGAHDLKMYASDAESAFERLALRAKAGTYVAFDVSNDEEGAPPRGKVMPFVSGEASLPPAGAEPCDIKLVSPKARYYFDGFHERMALPPSQVDEADIEAARSYADPSLRQRAARLDFAVRLWEAGMLGFARVCKAEVAVFVVMKKTREDGVYVLRPAWDMRRANERFRSLPHLNLGSPTAMAELDLSDEVTQGRGLKSTWGDFVKELERRRMKLLSVPNGCRYLCLVVMLMGFSWSPAICRGALEDVICDLPGFPRRARLIRGLMLPSFAEVAFVYWVFMGDFASSALVRESDATTVETVKQAARAKLKEVGLDMHADGVGDALPLSLGVAIAEQPCRLVASRGKIQNVIGATGAVMARGRATSQELSHIVSCKFVTKFEGDQTRRELWESVLNELHMLDHLAPLMHTDLEPRWSEVVFATDASQAGMGVVGAQATRSEVKAEVDRQWRFQQLHDMARDEDEELLLSGDDWECSKRGIPNTSGEGDVPPQRLMADVLEGYGGFGEETLFVDNARNPRRDLMDPSFVELMCSAILFGLLFMAAISMCFACLASGVGSSLESPRTSMIWGLPEMAKLVEQPGVFVVELVYCAFGARWLKPTRLITNVESLREPARRCSRDHPHQELRGRSAEGQLWTRLAAVYPPRLCSAYAKPVRKAIEAKRLELHDWRVREVRSPPEKPRAVMDHWADLSRWHLSWKGEWAYETRINVQEMRSVSSVARYLCRSSRCWFSRFLVLCDSMVTVGAVRKMRSSSRPLMTQLRKIGTISLATGVRLTLRLIPTDMNPADGPSRGEGIGSAEITNAKSEQKKSILNDQHPFERLLGDELEIKGMHDDYLDANDLAAEASMIAGVVEGLSAEKVSSSRKKATKDKKVTKEKARARPAARRRPFVPMKKKGPLAFESAAAKKLVNRSSLGGEQLERPVRLLIHAVQDDTNKEYLKEVEPFLRDVFHKRLPLSTPGQRDITVAAELDNRCFVERAPLNRGIKLYHRLVHIFPAWRSEIPIALRALHSWGKYQQTWEGGPASIEAIYYIAREALRRGHVDEGMAFLLAYDCYLREQDWLQLRAEDVHVSYGDSEEDPRTIKVAILLGRRHRSESVKTSQEQGLAIDDPGIALVIAECVKALGKQAFVFDTTATRAGSVRRQILSDGDMSWTGPMHTLRHSGPSHDILHTRRSIAEIQRRGRWTQSKSMAIYSKPHSLIVHNDRLPTKAKREGREARHDLRVLLRPMSVTSTWSSATKAASDILGEYGSQAFEPLDESD
ncbi:unnamed protein product [Prorocentrum cordatum]|uniref:RNA-directed RNA polymerase n=1 Tax=Prorocentrum cordatum TaxID=2364126 RepID=A0ABN9VY01_9DINO|nr:unnamed protein product [Polarella glacialis]